MAERDDHLERLEDLWPAPEPRPDFVARVVARLDDAGDRVTGAPTRTRRWLVPGLAAVTALAVAAAVALWLTRPPAAAPTAHAPAQGAVTATAYTSIALGDRGVVVAHPGAVLTWVVGADGTARVEQVAGEAFFRVERGGAFVVRTPAGEVRVTGTCFTVAVDEQLTTVDVHEGSVELADATSTVALAPGERGHLGGAAPARRRPTEPVAARVVSPDHPGPATPAPQGRRGDCFCFSDPRHLEADAQLLDEWAALCRVRADLPPYGLDTDLTAIEAAADQLGISGGERASFRAAALELTTANLARLREVYIAATGDEDGAASLDPDALAEQIVRTATLGEDARLRATLSQERAGHVAPPTDPSQLSPFEEMIRVTLTAGDDFERRLAARLGAARARSLRQRFGGWPGPDFDWIGCPE